MKQRRSFIIKRSFQLFLSLLLLHSSTLFAQTELTGFFDALSIHNSPEGVAHQFGVLTQSQFQF